MIRTTDPIAGHDSTFDNQVGYGSINAARAVQFVYGPNIIEHGSVQERQEAQVSPSNPIHIVNWPGIPSGQYGAARHVVRGSVTFSSSFTSAPAVWTRSREGLGSDDQTEIAYDPPVAPSTPQIWTPRTWVVTADQTGATLETYVYELTYGSQHYWWPGTVSDVHFAYTAVGPGYVTGAVDEPRGAATRLSASPNPTTGRAAIEYAVQHAGRVTISVYDVGGRRVRTVVRSSVGPGAHSTWWDLRADDGRLLGSGLYFIRLTADERTVVTRLALVR